MGPTGYPKCAGMRNRRLAGAQCPVKGQPRQGPVLNLEACEEFCEASCASGAGTGHSGVVMASVLAMTSHWVPHSV